MTATDASAAQAASPSTDDPRPGSLYDVPGWFFITDLVLFDWFLSRQTREEQRGDLLEMGAYLGKSAIFMNSHLQPGEAFTVCDLFDSEAPEERNDAEVRNSYSTLTRRAFEANFLAFHDELPTVVQAPTSVVPDHVEPDSCRFIHIDASHLYEHVRGDIAAAREALGEDGLVVLDDFRSEHTPGVACATWQAVLEEGLRPICVSPTKFYGTWGDPAAVQEELASSLRERGDCWVATQEVAGSPLVIVGGRKAKPPRLPVSRYPKAPVRDVEAQPKAVATGRRPALRRFAADVLPPVLTRAVARRLRARRGA